MNILVYEKVANYRYRLSEACTVGFKNSNLIDALKIHHQEQFHPFFQVNSASITAQRYYSWDGATFAINTSNLIIPSLVHDVGCQAINLGYLPRSMRKHFDREYYEQCLVYKVNKVRAMIHYGGCRLWGLIPKKEEIAKYASNFTITIK